MNEKKPVFLSVIQYKYRQIKAFFEQENKLVYLIFNPFQNSGISFCLTFICIDTPQKNEVRSNLHFKNIQMTGLCFAIVSFVV